MTKTIYLITIFTSIMFLTACTSSNEELISTLPEEQVVYTDSLSINETFGSLGALTQTSFTLEEMLVYAIQDEYAARTEYDYILSNFDVTTPFSNIIQSEETHISMLLPLFETYQIDVPQDTSLDHMILLEDLESTFATGVVAEEYNIAMYNLFLEQDDLPSDVRDVFIYLRDASLNHLDAFTKNLNKY
jgi:hypothetical protein